MALEKEILKDKEERLETYIFRIYRRESGDPDQFAGMVEEPISSESQPFSNSDELLSIFRKGGLTANKEVKGASGESKKPSFQACMRRKI